ncbi:hypothetical protein [Planomonospora sp. ID82291]|uniref:hypothetical protein n=1 Tax=Planomonospora sp. ID82291 TaxID=2738136 RepID=UPI0018C3E7AF|nr:hypothetical protein [Planomonospora sp. ID82291]MBG0818741.1 hypothetical protein [Planomonospora sp. ID82291]
MTDERKKIHPATQAALWVLSNGRCYFPGCPTPVVIEVRPGVYRKNAQISHIYGVRRGAARHREGMDGKIRDSFANLLLFCLAHHAEVDDEEAGEELYPPDLLRKWKRRHEGSSGAQLAGLGPITEEKLTELLTSVFTPPIERLQEIADQLADTGTLTAATVAELQQIVAIMAEAPAVPDSASMRSLAWAAEVYSRASFRDSAKHLSFAAESLPAVERMLEEKINKLYGAIDELRRLRR